MISLEDFSELLAVLYSIPLNPEQWPRFLDLLCEHTGSRGSFLICANSNQRLSIQHKGGGPHDDAAIAAYAASYSTRDPFVLPLLRSGRLGVIDCDELLTRDALEQTDMYRHLNAPAGYIHPGLIALTCTLRRFECISFWRSSEEGQLTRDNIRLLELLTPHIHAAMEIRQALGVAEARAAGAEAMADASTTPTFLLNGESEVLHANSAARQLLKDSDGFLTRLGFLIAAKPAMRASFRALIQQTQARGWSLGGVAAPKSFALERTSHKRPLQLLAAPISGYRVGAVLLLATDPDKPVVLRDDVLRTHYKLTPAEIEIANGLLTGYALEEIAALRQVSVSTIRDQVKSILAKTNTGRQTELVALLVTLPRIEDHPSA